MYVNDIVSKRRIWEEILQKSIDDLKKNEILAIREESNNLQQKVESMESLLRSINAKLETIQCEDKLRVAN